jgi:DNA-directed RNA polymerase subunit L
MFFTNLVTDDDTRITFEINDVDMSLVNAIRRVIFTDIQSVGFYFKLKDHFVHNDIDIKKNDSPIHNEFLAHRLSQIPLHLSKEEIKDWSPGNMSFTLKKTNNTGETINVTTNDIQIHDSNAKVLSQAEHARIFPANKLTKDHILITKLKPSLDKKHGTTVDLKMSAKKGIAKDCICWSVISHCSYYNTIDDEAVETHLKQLTEGKSAEESKQISDAFNTLDIYRFFKKNEHGDPNSFIFSLETECGLSPYDIFSEACVIILDMLESLHDEMDNVDQSSVVDIEHDVNVPNMYCISIKGHTHTIGNLIQGLFLNEYIRDKKGGPYNLQYIGYSVPHPLEEMFLLKIHFGKDVTEAGLIQFMSSGLNYVRTLVKDVHESWVIFGGNNH